MDYYVALPGGIPAGVTIPISGSVSILNFPASQAVTGTFWQAVQPVSGPLTNAELRASPVPVSGLLTDVQLRASAVPVSGVFFQAVQPVSGTFFQTTQPVSGTITANIGTSGSLLTDTQLRATPVPVSATQSGTWTVQPGNTANTTAWKVDGSAVTQPVSGAFFQAVQPVSGAFFQATQPISAVNLDVALSTRLKPADTLAGITTVGSITNPVAVTQSGVWTVQPGNTANTTAWKVDGSAVTQPISAVALPLPTGAATAAKQPALGTAGVASANVITVQGIASMTPLKVDGSGVTQPVSDVMNGTALQADLTITTIAVPLRVGAANQVGRRVIFILANAAGYTFGFSAGSQPFALTNGSLLMLFVGENITVWAKKSSGTNTVTVAEIS